MRKATKSNKGNIAIKEKKKTENDDKVLKRKSKERNDDGKTKMNKKTSKSNKGILDKIFKDKKDKAKK